jgi:hypothetical protein
MSEPHKVIKKSLKLEDSLELLNEFDKNKDRHTDWPQDPKDGYLFYFDTEDPNKL